MSQAAVALVLLASGVGSLINLPLWHRETEVRSGWTYRFGPWVYYQPPAIEHQVIAVNLGGAVVPVGLSVWLLGQANPWDVAAATAIIAAVTHASARVVPDEGIVMPGLIAPAVAAVVALSLAHGHGGEPAAIAYVSGSVGTLLGADILNLHRLRGVGPGIVSIGGAGVFDGIFLVGIVAAVLA